MKCMRYFNYILLITLLSFSLGGCQFEAPKPNDSSYEKEEGEGNGGY